MYRLLIIFLLTYLVASAQQNIEIIGGSGINNPQVAIINFNNKIVDIIKDDLTLTGEIDINDKANNLTKYIITGNMMSNLFSYQLTEANTNILNQSVTFNDNNLRQVAHTISNEIYKKITNSNGIFMSKIAYITKQNKKYSIVVADYDGFNPKTIISVDKPLNSLTANSSAQQIAYISFEKNKPIVYVQDLYKARRYIVANFSGSNSSPSFINDSQLSVTLTKDGGSHVYLVENTPFTKLSTAKNIINFGTIDTEATGIKNKILFTSNKDGGPQIFIFENGMPKRLTFNLGNYNTTAKLSHDASKVTFINKNSGALKAYIMDLTTGNNYSIGFNTSRNKSPSFAPNNKLVLYSDSGNLFIANTTATKQSQIKNTAQVIDQIWLN